MGSITRRPFRILCDFPAVRAFMVRIYERDWRNGVASPYLEYALSADWADQRMAYRDAIWEDDGRIVAFCFYEARPGTAHFSLDPAYHHLAPDMVDYAIHNLADDQGKTAFQLFRGQDALIKAAEERGYTLTDSYEDRLFDLSKPLDYPLPKGFKFVTNGNVDPGKMLLCCWKGFNHESEGPWDGRLDPAYRCMYAPNATPEYGIAIEAEDGEYVCWCGMWWTPENHLAYMEPLCTVPEYRHRGLASAALSEMARVMRPLGATHMTGGSNPMYEKIGYGSGIGWRRMEKIEPSQAEKT